MENRKRFRRRKVSRSNTILIWLLVLLGLNISFIGLYTIYNKHVTPEFNQSISIITRHKSSKIDEYIEKLGDTYIESSEVKGEFVSILYNNGTGYATKIFDYYNGNELSFKDFLKADNYEMFLTKEIELLSLKYPTFIVNGINSENVRRVYYPKTNEVVVYYYDYVTSPRIDEQLTLKVNYNEIKEYLKISPLYDEAYENEDGNKIDTTKKLIAITFDDGPGPYTMKALKYLTDNKARATFFMLGNRLKSYESAVKQAYEDKMEIAYHSYAHKYLPKQSVTDVTNELNTSNAILESIIGENFKIVRPPYGSINETVMKTLNMPIIIWSVDTNDWQAKNKNSEYLCNYVLEHAKDGDIVLFHDIHITSVEAMEKLLPELYARGFQVVTVSELANAKGKSMDTMVKHYSFR